MATKKKVAKVPVAAEVTVKEAIAFLKVSKDNQGRSWDRVVSVMRDPNDLTRIVSLLVHEAE